MFRVALLLVLVLLAPASLPAQPAAAQEEDEKVTCAYQRKNHPDYILWLCNPEGTEASAQGSLLWLRKNAAGTEVMTAVWQGQSTELATRAEELISRHAKARARCASYVHLARVDKGAIEWNLATPAMIAELRRAARTSSPVCYAFEPGSADYVIVWGETEAQMPNAFSVQIPDTARHDDKASAPELPARTTTRLAWTNVRLAVYRVDPGMDNSILRLGLSVFHGSSPIGPSTPPPLSPALRFLTENPGTPPSP